MKHCCHGANAAVAFAGSLPPPSLQLPARLALPTPKPKPHGGRETDADGGGGHVLRARARLCAASIRGHPFRTSAKIPDFFTPSPLSTNSRNLPY